MNMKSLLKELVKDPQIKALYNEGFDRSLINKLIIESLMEQDDDENAEKIKELKSQLKQARKKLQQ